jgi:glycosyltransferase involved in cell wall biosynthesis
LADPTTLIAIPVYNERKHLADVLRRVRQFHDQVLVVDDGSSDGTADLLIDLARDPGVHVLRHPKNRGYGSSLIDAFDWAGDRGYEWVVTMDCDDQHEPERLPAFFAEIARDDADLISGSRYMQTDDAVGEPPKDRRRINVAVTTLLNALFDWNLTDSFCGFKAHRVGPTRRLQLDETGYAFPLQLWPRVYQAGLRVRELPVRLIYNDPNRSFGAQLDDARRRLTHYLSVLNRELQEPVVLTPALRRQAEAVLCGCS